MGIDVRSRGFRFAVVYVLAAASLATAAQLSDDPRYYLAALLLTIPSGVVAIVGVYVVYGIVVQIVTAASSGLTGDQISDRTFTLTGPVNVALFALAAAGNVWLLRRAVVARRRRSAAPR